jgi:hypothetical protein
MRGRAYALIDAMYARDLEPLRRLAEDYGVTHLLIDRRHFNANHPPRYFAPFTNAIHKALSGDSKCFIVPKLIDQAVFAHDNDFVLDLRLALAEPSNAQLGCGGAAAQKS